MSLGDVIETIDRELGAARDRLDELVAQAQRELDGIARLEQAHLVMTGDVAGPAPVDGSEMTPEELRALVGPPPEYPALEAVKDSDVAAGDDPATSPALSPPASESFSAPIADRILSVCRDADDWLSAPEIALRGRVVLSQHMRRTLQRLVRTAVLEAEGATKARRYRIARIVSTTTSPADTSAAPAKTPPKRPTRPRTSPAASSGEVPMGGARSGEEPSTPAPPKVSARVRKQLERDAAAAELAKDVLGVGADPVVPEPLPVPPASIAELVLKQLALYDEPVAARTVAQACFRNQHDVAHALRELAAAGRCTSHRCDGITLYAAKAAA